MECQSAVLLRRLNYNDAKSLEGAASLSLTRAHAEITPEHLLLKILEHRGVNVPAQRCEWNTDATWQSLLNLFDVHPRSLRIRIEQSVMFDTLLQAQSHEHHDITSNEPVSKTTIMVRTAPLRGKTTGTSFGAVKDVSILFDRHAEGVLQWKALR